MLRDNDRNRPAPEETFQGQRTLEIGGERIELGWHGSNHSPDNSYIYLPDHDTLMLVDVINVGWGRFTTSTSRSTSPATSPHPRSHSTTSGLTSSADTWEDSVRATTSRYISSSSERSSRISRGLQRVRPHGVLPELLAQHVGIGLRSPRRSSSSRLRAAFGEVRRANRGRRHRLFRREYRSGFRGRYVWISGSRIQVHS